VWLGDKRKVEPTARAFWNFHRSLTMREAQIEARAIQREETGVASVGSVFFLASSDADFLSGETIKVDGGKHLL
jgi:NAD(P)-dependent dehydrogenase (short-subunit alcohol dehydrogenase family)